MRTRDIARSPWTRLAVVAVSAVAMAYLEAAVVVYLRAYMATLPHSAFPVPRPSSLTPAWLRLPFFTLLPPSAVRTALPVASIARTEVLREAATIVMLACVGWLGGTAWRSRLGAFLLAFGVWDIGYYAFLKLLIGWPASLTTGDVLFLIPGPWVAPVWLPVAVSAIMVAAGVWLVSVEATRRR